MSVYPGLLYRYTVRAERDGHQLTGHGDTYQQALDSLRCWALVLPEVARLIFRRQEPPVIWLRPIPQEDVEAKRRKAYSYLF